MPDGYMRNRAGIGWVDDVRPGAVKVLVGEYALEKGYIDPKTGIAQGLFERSTQKRFESLVGGLCDFFPDYFKAHDTHGRTLGDALVHRARFAAKGELARFRQPVWDPLYRLITQRLADRLPITLDDLYAAQETAITLQVVGEPGVYFRFNPEVPHEVYVGETVNLGGGRADRTDGMDRLAGCCVTQDKKSGRELEQNILGSLLEKRTKINRPSAVVLPRGTDGIDWMKDYVRKFYRNSLRREFWGMS